MNSQNIILQDWYPRVKDATFLSTIFKILAIVSLIALVIRAWPILQIAGLIAILVGLMALQARADKDKEDLYVNVPTRKAATVVLNTLDSKQISYLLISANRFELEDGLQLRVTPWVTNPLSFRHRYGATSILIGPINPENKMIANSLKARIKDGFALTGLQ